MKYSKELRGWPLSSRYLHRASKDITGRQAAALSREMGVRPGRGEAALIEVRRESTGMSYTAHSERKYVNLLIEVNEGLVLTATDCEGLKQTQIKVPALCRAEPVQQFSQIWCPQNGAIGPIEQQPIRNEAAERQRLQSLALRLLSLTPRNG